MTGIYSDHLTEPVWNWLVAAANFTASRLSFVPRSDSWCFEYHYTNGTLASKVKQPQPFTRCLSSSQLPLSLPGAFSTSARVQLLPERWSRGGSFSLLASGLVTAVVCTLPFMSGSSGIERLQALWRETFGGDDMLQACNLVAFLEWMFMSCYYHNCGSRCQKTTSLKYLSLCFTCFVRSKYHALCDLCSSADLSASVSMMWIVPVWRQVTNQHGRSIVYDAFKKKGSYKFITPSSKYWRFWFKFRFSRDNWCDLLMVTSAGGSHCQCKL